MNKILGYLTAFLSGVAIAALWLALYAIKHGKPVINAENYIESLEQAIKKLKQSGEGNNQDVVLDVKQAEQEEKKKERKPFLGISLKKKNKV